MIRSSATFRLLIVALSVILIGLAYLGERSSLRSVISTSTSFTKIIQQRSQRTNILPNETLRLTNFSEKTAGEIVARDNRDGKDSYGQDENVFEMLDFGSPWRDVAPSLDTKIPSWISEYVDFHNKSLETALSLTNGTQTDTNRYLIFTCRPVGKGSCTGTGNRHRGIMPTFLVAVLTRRIFLIDIQNPQPLDQILLPNLVRWNAVPPHLSQLEDRELVKARYIEPPMLDNATYFNTTKQVTEIIATTPKSLWDLWESDEMKAHLQSLGIERPSPKPADLYRWIFFTLYRPSSGLTQTLTDQQRQLNMTANQTFVSIHVRTGGGGAWRGYGDENRYNTSCLASFLTPAQRYQESMPGGEHVPIVVVADDPVAKEVLQKEDPSSVRFVNNQIQHTALSRRTSLQSMLNVWADIIMLAQSKCMVRSHSSFSQLAARLSPQRCVTINSGGMLSMHQKKYNVSEQDTLCQR